MAFATDLVDEGFETVVARARDRGGFDAVEMGAIYHHARDVHPHNPRHTVRFLDGGACFFRLDPAAFAGQRIQPKRAALLDEVDPLRRLQEAADALGVGTRAWAIALHNCALGERHPDATTENAFGDRLLTDLCPANPDARAYARTVLGELSRTGVETIVAESVCHLPFDHGFHHERTPYPLSETTRFLLALCFCEHCRARAERAGVAVEAARAFVREAVAAAVNGEPSPLDGVPLERTAVAALAGGELGGMLAMREGVVGSLVAEAAESVEAAGPARFVFMDSMGAGEGADQTGPPVADRAWRFGIDLPAVARSCHGVTALGYSRGFARFAADVERYREVLPEGTPLSLVVRTMPPDCLGPTDLGPKLAHAEKIGIDWVECYVYGLMRLEGLDWFRAGRRR